MLDYIKNQINGRMNVPDPIEVEKSNDIPDETILEYAHVIQELDDLTTKGTDHGRERKMAIDIPLDEDIEVETIEFNIGDGRVTDVPGDATVQEGYVGMKTYEKFYQEASAMIPRMSRESDALYRSRVSEVADKNYNEYYADCKRKGLFGFDRINIGNDKVPSKINVNFGPITEGSNESFVTKVNAFFATDKKHNITRKQLDSLNVVKNGAFKKIGKPLMAYMESKYDIPNDASVWDVCTPKTLIVPKGNNDSFCVVLEYTNEITGKNEFFGWTRPIDPTIDGNMPGGLQDHINPDSCEKINMESFINESRYENHDVYIQEATIEANRPKRPIPSRFFQEAIDFGGGSSDGDGGSDLPPAEGESDDTPSVDTGSDSSSSDGGNEDPSVDTGNASDAPESNDDSSDQKEEANVNDVSKDIAEQVAQKTQDDSNTGDTTGTDDTEITFDDDDMDSTDDISSDDETASVDDQLDDLDNSADDDMDDSVSEPDMNFSEPGEPIDVSKMTIDQLIESGSEKLKGMTIEQIKNFLSSDSPDAVQEAFFLTKKNINKEIDVNLRKCLGILNDNKMNIDKLIRSFKLSGKKLNRVLSKAVKFKDIYSSDGQDNIKKLNTALTNLMANLKHSKDQSYVSKIKQHIREFISQAKIVGSFVEDKLRGTTSSDVVNEQFVQEAFLLNNIKDKITKALIPVKGNMEELKKLHDEGNLSRGRIVKRYSAKSTNAYWSFGTSSKSSNMPGGDHNFIGYSKHALNIDNALKLLNKATRKKGIDNIELITALADKLDVVSDYIETIIDDTIENKEIIKRIGILSGDIINLIDEFIGDDISTNVETDNESSIDDITVSEESERDDSTELSDNDDSNETNFNDDDMSDDTTIDDGDETDDETDDEGKDDE